MHAGCFWRQSNTVLLIDCIVCHLLQSNSWVMFLVPKKCPMECFNCATCSQWTVLNVNLMFHIMAERVWERMVWLKMSVWKRERERERERRGWRVGLAWSIRASADSVPCPGPRGWSRSGPREPWGSSGQTLSPTRPPPAPQSHWLWGGFGRRWHGSPSAVSPPGDTPPRCGRGVAGWGWDRCRRRGWGRARTSLNSSCPQTNTPLWSHLHTQITIGSSQCAQLKMNN